MLYAVEVIADSSEKFVGNGLTFPTVEAAEIYAKDLYARWTAVRSWRVVFFRGWEKVVATPARREAA